MVEHDYVIVELDMLPEDAKELVESLESEPIVAEFEHHAEPKKIAFGEVLSATWNDE